MTDQAGGRWQRRTHAIVTYNGLRYKLDLIAIERAYIRGVIAGRYTSRESLAEPCGVSRSTVSRFMAGRTTSPRVTAAILRELGVNFDDVAEPC